MTLFFHCPVTFNFAAEPLEWRVEWWDPMYTACENDYVLLSTVFRRRRRHRRPWCKACQPSWSGLEAKLMHW